MLKEGKNVISERERERGDNVSRRESGALLATFRRTNFFTQKEIWAGTLYFGVGELGCIIKNFLWQSIHKEQLKKIGLGWSFTSPGPVPPLLRVFRVLV